MDENFSIGRFNASYADGAKFSIVLKVVIQYKHNKQRRNKMNNARRKELNNLATKISAMSDTKNKEIIQRITRRKK